MVTRAPTAPPSDPADGIVQIGKFGRCHGVTGWILVVSYTDPIDNILNYLPWQIQQAHDSWVLESLADSKFHHNKIMVQIPGYTDRTQAETLTHASISINKSQLPELEGEEFYWHQLQGLKVINTAGIPLGTVKYVFNTGANDVLVLTDCAPRRERLVPYTQDVIQSIDLPQKTLIVDWHEDD